MQDHGDLVYLDVQKTGSTFVSSFLRWSCTLKMLRLEQHAPVTGDYRKDAYYLATVRHPLALYMSLYRYGVDGHGGIARRIRKAGRGDVYEGGLDRWLEFILDPMQAPILREGFDSVAALGLGLMTYRFIRLAIPNPMDVLPTARSMDDIRRLYAAHNLAPRVLRNESLNDELRSLAFEEQPQWFDQEIAAEMLGGERMNSSSAPIPAPPSSDLMAEIERREALLLELFYSETP